MRRASTQSPVASCSWLAGLSTLSAYFRTPAEVGEITAMGVRFRNLALVITDR